MLATAGRPSSQLISPTKLPAWRLASVMLFLSACWVQTVIDPDSTTNKPSGVLPSSIRREEVVISRTTDILRIQASSSESALSKMLKGKTL